MPILERLLEDFADFDAKILVEETDPNLSGHDGKISNLGPNPKIRNMSRGYREAKGDIVWIIDCNVWVGRGVAGRMVDLLCGFSPGQLGIKYKFVHQLPLVVDLTSSSSNFSLHPTFPVSNGGRHIKSSFLSRYGGLLEELFLSTSHAKFYTAISTVAVAPCIIGKSNMFRRSHLNALTFGLSSRPPGIDYFSDNICEDHLIGDLLWRSQVPASVCELAELEGKSSIANPPIACPTTQWRNHGLLPSDLAIQPTSHLPLVHYLARRVRWLRVRKFTVFLATLVEPGTESLLCSLYLAFGLTTHPYFTHRWHIPPTWVSFISIWLLSMMSWMAVDYLVWARLQRAKAIEGDYPEFLRARRMRKFSEWFLGWVGREGLALGIWVWAVLGGVTVVWRGRRFWVGVDMRVHEIEQESLTKLQSNGRAKMSRDD